MSLTVLQQHSALQQRPAKLPFAFGIFFFPSPRPQHPPHVTPWCRGLVPPSRHPAAGARPCWCLYCKHQLGLVPSKSPCTRKRVWVGDRSSSGCSTVPCVHKKRDRSLSSQGTRLLRPCCWSWPRREGEGSAGGKINCSVCSLSRTRRGDGRSLSHRRRFLQPTSAPEALTPCRGCSGGHPGPYRTC